jgi:hypothetical protein
MLGTDPSQLSVWVDWNDVGNYLVLSLWTSGVAPFVFLCLYLQARCKPPWGVASASMYV